MDGWTRLRADGEAAGDGEDAADGLDDERAEAEEIGDVGAVEVRHHRSDAA